MNAARQRQVQAPDNKPFTQYFAIENATRGTLVAARCRVASSALDRSIGLLRTREVGPGEGLLIERSPSIHMFFMRYPIDAIFIDRLGRVTKVVPSLRPWRIVAWARGARDCIELRAGAAAASETEVGDQLVLHEHGWTPAGDLGWDEGTVERSVPATDHRGT